MVTFGRITSGMMTFDRITLCRITLGMMIFDRITFGQTFGTKTFGKMTFLELHLGNYLAEYFA